MIYTEQEIESKVSQVSGTHIKRNNLRRKLQVETNNELTEMINDLQRKIRALKARGAKQSELREYFAKITELEMRFL